MLGIVLIFAATCAAHDEPPMTRPLSRFPTQWLLRLLVNAGLAYEGLHLPCDVLSVVKPK